MNPRRQHQLPTGNFISHKQLLNIRFSEVDAMGVVWHGNYARYFEEGREALGKIIQMGFLDLEQAGLYVPVIHLCNDFRSPLRYGEEYELETRLYENDRALIETTSHIRALANGTLLASGHTIQLFTTTAGEQLFTQPKILRNFYERFRGQFCQTSQLK